MLYLNVAVAVAHFVWCAAVFFFCFSPARIHKQLAFRSCHALRERKLSDVRRILGVAHGVESNDETTLNLDKAVKQHLKESAETFPMGDVERQVANQVNAMIIIRSFVRSIHFCSYVRLSYMNFVHFDYCGLEPHTGALPHGICILVEFASPASAKMNAMMRGFRSER